MVWLTRQQVRNAAVTSNIAATYCSMIHWHQILEAGPKSFLSGEVNYGSDYCGLCQHMYLRGKGKWVCPLNKTCCTGKIVPSFICCPEYYTAVKAIKCDLDTSSNVGEQPNEWYEHTKVSIRCLIERLRDAVQEMSGLNNTILP